MGWLAQARASRRPFMPQTTVTDSVQAPDAKVSNLLVYSLGFNQILVWAASYYLPAVLSLPIAADTGWPLSWIVSGLTLGLLTGGFCAPRIGMIIKRRGGRHVLAASSVLLAAGLAILAVSASLPSYLFGWLVIGCAMGTGMHDAVFATFGVLYGRNARKAITNFTLLSGFASSVAWPLSTILEQHLGWRGTLWAYAAIHLAFSLPLYLLLVPNTGPAEGHAPLAQSGSRSRYGASWICREFFLMAMVISLTTAISGSIFVNLLAILKAAGHSLASTVALGALVGPAIVVARIVEKASGERITPPRLLAGSTALILLGVVGLLYGAATWAGPALISFGAGVGIGVIARGTVPLYIFGPIEYPAIVGKVAMPAMMSQALAPSISALVIDRWGTATLLYCLGAMGFISLVIALVLAGTVARRDSEKN
jgi:predicted MFS family arabinose efflux permease